MPGVAFISANILALYPNARLIVEGAFGADLAATPGTWTWTDITTDVRWTSKVRIKPGRSDETSQAQPADCSFVLDNTTGNYSPYNPKSTRYPNVRRGTPIRVSVDLGTGGGLVTRFFGFANGFTPGWDITGNLAVVKVSASGILRRLQQGKSPLRSTLYRSNIAAGPVAYWSLEDGTTATQAASALSGGAPLTWNGTVPTRASSGPPGSAPLIKLGSDTALSGAVAPYTSAQNWWGVQFVFNMAARPVVDTPILSVYTNGSYARWDLIYGPGGGGIMFWNIYNSSGVAVQTSVCTTAFDVSFPGSNPVGRDIIVGWNIHQNGSNIAVDGAYFSPDEGNGLLQSFNPATLTAVTNGTVTRIEVLTGYNRTGWTYGHISVWGGPFTLYYPQMNGYKGERAADRIARLCAEEGVPLTVNASNNAVTESFEQSPPKFATLSTWQYTTLTTHSGTWSRVSAAIGDSAQSDEIVTVPAGATSMSVWYKVSSELNFDFFRILFDGVQQFQASGEVDWTQFTGNVTGVKKVTFRYIKDSGTVAGSDLARIDDLTFVGVCGTLMGPQSIDSFVNVLRECEAADGGVLYEDSNGLGYLTNFARYNQSPSLTVDMNAGHVADPFAPVDDDQRNRNLVKVDRKNGSSATYEDKPGPLGTKAIGTYDNSLTVNVQSDAVLYDRASWEVHKGTVEGLRYPDLNLDFVATPSLLPAWLATTLNERIDVINVTSKATQHPPGDISLLLEGYTETLAPDEWTVKPANCSPYDPYRVFKLDDTALGRLDTSGANLTAGVSAGATSLTVATTSGPLWITTATLPAQFPFDLNVGGWKVTVTAIAGTTSPQTFTVNPVPGAIPINAVVKLWKPGVLAL